MTASGSPPSGATAIHAAPNPKYFNRGRGVTWYNLLSDQCTGLNAITVPGTLRDSLVLLAVVLEQQTELQPTQIMTDTGAYPVRPEDEARLSPFGHEHINMLGRYSFSVPEAVARGELRPLSRKDDV
jgi:hypothetical protein